MLSLGPNVTATPASSAAPCRSAPRQPGQQATGRSAVDALLVGSGAVEALGSLTDRHPIETAQTTAIAINDAAERGTRNITSVMQNAARCANEGAQAAIEGEVGSTADRRAA
jgi:hypothetical protein